MSRVVLFLLKAALLIAWACLWKGLLKYRNWDNLSSSLLLTLNLSGSLFFEILITFIFSALIEISYSLPVVRSRSSIYRISSLLLAVRTTSSAYLIGLTMFLPTLKSHNPSRPSLTNHSAYTDANTVGDRQSSG